MTIDMTSFDAALKVHYTDDEVQRLTYQDHPLLALMAKDENFYGKNLPIPIIYGNSQGRSAVFANAQSNLTYSRIEDFVLTRAKDYAVAEIDGETWDASERDADAFMSAVTTEFDGAFEAISNSLASALYRSGTGSIGQVGSISTNTITLLAIEDVVQFEVGMRIVASDTDGGANLTGSEVISAVDRTLGTLTSTNTNWTDGITGATLNANDYLMMQGDLNAKIKGLSAWIPSSVTATSFFSVDRTIDKTRLGGQRYDGSSDPIDEALINGAIRAAREGGKISVYMVDFERYGDLEKTLGSKRTYTEARVSADVAFPGIEINGPKGMIKVIPDQDCQNNIAWGLDMRTWKLYTLKKAPRILQRDGNKTLRTATADTDQFRVGYYGQCGCRAPGRNVRVTLPT